MDESEKQNEEKIKKLNDELEKKDIEKNSLQTQIKDIKESLNKQLNDKNLEIEKTKKKKKY